MKQLKLTQGSPEWLSARLRHFTASEASVMLGMSSYMTRTELLQLKKTGVAKEVSAQTQKLFDKGHAVEELARPIVEINIEEELYPITGSLNIEELPLLASFDGLTIMEDIVFEHKLFNKGLINSLENGVIPEQYRPQLEQQLLISGAEKAIFVCSDGTLDNMVSVDYFPDLQLRQRIISGWKQFQKDLETFEVTQEQVKPEAKPLMELPTLSISIVGEVSNSNMELYKNTALDFIRNINTDLQTDQDFVDAENTIKFCDKAEKELEAVKKQALGQTADIDMLFKTVDQLKEEMRSKRLTLNREVKTKKESIKIDLLTYANKTISQHIEKINKTLSGVVFPASIKYDFAGAIKGKRNISSMQDAINTELSKAKIDSNDLCELISMNLGVFETKAKDYKFLFNDLQSIITKDYHSFHAIIDSRITQHKESEKKRMEAEREAIRIQEQQKAEQAEREKLEKEREAIKQEEMKKAKAKFDKELELAKQEENNREAKRLQKECFIDNQAPHEDALRSERTQQEIDKKIINTQDGSLSNEKTITIPVKDYEKLADESRLFKEFLEKVNELLTVSVNQKNLTTETDLILSEISTLVAERDNALLSLIAND